MTPHLPVFTHTRINERNVIMWMKIRMPVEEMTHLPVSTHTKINERSVICHEMRKPSNENSWQVTKIRDGTKIPDRCSHSLDNYLYGRLRLLRWKCVKCEQMKWEEMKEPYLTPSRALRPNQSNLDEHLDQGHEWMMLYKKARTRIERTRDAIELRHQ